MRYRRFFNSKLFNYYLRNLITRSTITQKLKNSKNRNIDFLFVSKHCTTILTKKLKTALFEGGGEEGRSAYRSLGLTLQAYTTNQNQIKLTLSSRRNCLQFQTTSYLNKITILAGLLPIYVYIIYVYILYISYIYLYMYIYRHNKYIQHNSAHNTQTLR